MEFGAGNKEVGDDVVLSRVKVGTVEGMFDAVAFGVLDGDTAVTAARFRDGGGGGGGIALRSRSCLSSYF